MSAGRRRVILDCDPGHDDAMAILLAAATPAIELIAITTVAGNQTLDKTTLNARRVCSVARIENVPIVPGRDRPIVRDQLIAASIHGESGLDGPAWPEPTVEADSRDAVDLIVSEALAGDLTIVAVGPLTNVASAMQREPRVREALERVVLMGGAIGLGNWTPAAEFNIFADPEAAEIVFTSGVPITMVPLEVTHQALATDAVLSRIDALRTPVGEMAGELLRFFAATYERVFGFPAPAVHDPCAVAALIEPGIVSTRSMHVAIETAPSRSYGRTLCDVHGVTGEPVNAQVGMTLQADRFWDLMIEALGRYPAAA